MISKDAFKELVLAGAITVKNALAIKRMEEIIEDNLDDDEDDPLPDEVFEIARKCSFTQPFSHIVSCIAEIVNTDKAERVIVKYKYVDAVSLFVFNSKEAERYTDLVYQYLYNPENAVEELSALEDSLPEEELYYVRRNLTMRSEMQ